MDHARDVPFPRTEAGFVEVLPDAIAEHIPKMCVAVDRLRRKRRRSEARRRIAEDRRGRGPDEVGDTERLRPRIEAAQRAAISRRFLV